MAFGDVAFSGSKFIFRALVVPLFLAAICVPFTMADGTPRGLVLAVAFSGCCLLAIPALYDAKRFPWAARGVTGIIFLAYAAYAAFDVLFPSEAVEAASGGPVIPVAIRGFFVIGLPALWYTIFGRFSFSKDGATSTGDISER